MELYRCRENECSISNVVKCNVQRSNSLSWNKWNWDINFLKNGTSAVSDTPVCFAVDHRQVPSWIHVLSDKPVLELNRTSLTRQPSGRAHIFHMSMFLSSSTLPVVHLHYRTLIALSRLYSLQAVNEINGNVSKFMRNKNLINCNLTTSELLFFSLLLSIFILLVCETQEGTWEKLSKWKEYWIEIMTQLSIKQ